MFHEKNPSNNIRRVFGSVTDYTEINSRIDMHEFWSLDWLFKWFGCTRFSKNS